MCVSRSTLSAACAARVSPLKIYPVFWRKVEEDATPRLREMVSVGKKRAEKEEKVPSSTAGETWRGRLLFFFSFLCTVL